MKKVKNPIFLEIDGVKYPSVDDYKDIKKHMDNGEAVVHWEFGNSLFPVIRNKEYCLIKPLKKDEQINDGDCVFCKIFGEYYMVHRVIESVAVRNEIWYRIGDTWGKTYGWTTEVYGKAYSTDVYEDVKERKTHNWLKKLVN